MPRVLIKRLFVSLVLLLLLACGGCKADEYFKTEDYLQELAIASGIASQGDNYLDALAGWQIVKEKYPEVLDYAYLFKTLGRLANRPYEKAGQYDEEAKVSVEEGRKIMMEVIEDINNREFPSTYEYQYKEAVSNNNKNLTIGSLVIDEEGQYQRIKAIENGQYVYEEAAYEDVYENLKIADSYEIDFSQAEDISYLGNNLVYENHNFQLLANTGKNHSFYDKGFNISYSLSSSGLSLRLSKKKDKFNFYYDVTIYNVRPSYNWEYEDGKLKEAYFKLNYQTTDEIGVSNGRYLNYYLDLQNLSSQEFLNKTAGFTDEKIEETLKICTIRTPLPNIPYAYLNMDVLVKIYATGRAEVVLANNHELGFEIRNGHFRLINDNSHDIDAILKGSARAVVGLNFNLETAAVRLMDIEADAGIRAAVSSTLHLYDEEGQLESLEHPLSYETLEALTTGNSDVKLCGDVSLHWLLNLYLNTSKTVLNKWGFARSKEILDDDNQIFGNLQHIEDGHFVKSCTRKGRDKVVSSESISADKLALERYAVVIDVGKSYDIVVSALPASYDVSQLVYSSSDDSVAVAWGKRINGLKPGVCQICVKTADGVYSAYLNVLVSG